MSVNSTKLPSTPTKQQLIDTIQSQKQTNEIILEKLGGISEFSEIKGHIKTIDIQLKGIWTLAAMFVVALVAGYFRLDDKIDRGSTSIVEFSGKVQQSTEQLGQILQSIDGLKKEKSENNTSLTNKNDSTRQ